MPDDAGLDGLLMQWEEHRERGEPVTPEELCRACPEHLDALRRRIRALQAMAEVLDLGGLDDAGPSSDRNPASLPQLPGYEILEAIVSGGMGVVYKARDLTLDRLVAIKVPRLRCLAVEREVQRFHREPILQARLSHENIVPVYDAKLHEGRPYFVMPFLAGGSLTTHLKQFKDDPQAAAALMEKVARAVDYAHKRGVFHRDLKPGNILLDENGKPWVSDFGLAFLRAAVEGSDPKAASPTDETETTVAERLTEPGARPGTPPYMAPEQLAKDGQSVTAATDVWALGVILYELVTGRPPFAGQTKRELEDQICGEPPPPPRQRAPRVSRRLERVILRCLEKDPRRRYPDAGALAEALASCRPWRLRWGWAAAVTAWMLLSTAAGWKFFLDKSARAVPRHEPDPLAVVKDYQQRLERGEEVTLIGDVGGPRWHSWQLTDGHIIYSPDGQTFSVETSRSCLLELLPNSRMQGYRLSAKVKHVSSDKQMAQVGLYFGHSLQGSDHCFCALTINDVDSSNRKGRDVTLRGLRLRTDAADVVRFRGLSLRYLPALENPNQPPVWRDLAVEVKSDSLVIFWEKEPPQVIPRLELERIRERLRRGPPAQFPQLDLLAQFAAQEGLGLYVSQGWASFKQVRLQPLKGKD